MVDMNKEINKDKQINYNKRYRTASKIFIVLEFLIFLFFNRVTRCSCGIPAFNSIPPMIVWIIEVILYFITRNRVDTKKEQKKMIIVYIILLIIFGIALIAIQNPHDLIIS